jgi:hypothetical protein
LLERVRGRLFVFGLISYFDIAGMYDKFVTVEGRVNGTFKDLNVYGSYMVLAAAYLMHGTILGNKRTLLVTIPSLAAVCIGVFLSFSRRSWGATLLAMIVVTIAAYVTAENPRTRRRIVWMSPAAIAIGIIAILAVLADEDAQIFAHAGNADAITTRASPAVLEISCARFPCCRTCRSVSGPYVSARYSSLIRTIPSSARLPTKAGSADSSGS